MAHPCQLGLRKFRAENERHLPPYLFADYNQLQAYLSGAPGEELLTSLDRLDIKGLGFFLRTFRNVTTRDTPITKAEDFKGITLRTPNNPLFVSLFKSLGANPTPMAFSEVYSALQLKAIDGQENPVEVPWNNRLYEVQGQLNMTQHLADSFILALSSAAWEKKFPPSTMTPCNPLRMK